MSRPARHILAALLALWVLFPHGASASLHREPAGLTATASTHEAIAAVDRGLSLRHSTTLGSPSRGRRLHQDNHGALFQMAEAISYARNNPVNFVDPTGLAAARATPQMMANLWEMENAELRYSQGIAHTKDSLRDVVTSASNRQWKQAKFFLAQAAGNVRQTVSAAIDRFLADPALSMVGVGGVLQTGKVAVRAVVAEGKFGYLFGQASGRAHNVARAEQNLAQMSRLGLRDNAASRQLIQQHFDDLVADPSNIARTFSNKHGAFEVRESLFMGPSGQSAKFESTWQVVDDGNRRLTTVIPMGGP